MKSYSSSITALFILLLVIACKTLTTLETEKGRYKIIKEAQGDINLDGIADWVMMTAGDKTESSNITVLIANKDGQVSQKLSNENLTHAFLELYGELPEIEVTPGTLSLSYYGGMCHREARTIVFKFKSDLNHLYFEAIHLSEHNVCNDSEPTSTTTTSPDLQKTRFEDFVDSI